MLKLATGWEMPLHSFTTHPTPLHESPLWKLLLQVQTRLGKLRQKYPLTQKDPLPEARADAEKILHFTEVCLDVLQKKILVPFDNGAAPGIYGIAKIVSALKEVKKLLDEIRTKESLSSALFAPKHPIIYELMDIAIELLQHSPTTLEPLIPFFNPEAVPTVLQSGIAGALLHVFVGKFQILHITHPTSTYSYQLQYPNTDPTLEPITEIIDGNLEYQLYKQWLLFANFLPLTSRYLAIHGEKHGKLYEAARTAIEQGATRRRSERARIFLLQNLVEKESETIRRAVAEFEAFKEPQLQVKLEDKQHVHWAIQTLKDRKLALVRCQELQKSLEEKSAHYSERPVSSLLHPYEELEAHRLQQRESGLDTAYCSQPLPESIITITDGAEASLGPTIDMQVRLKNEIRYSILRLQSTEEMLRQQIHDITETTLSTWQNILEKHRTLLQKDMEQNIAYQGMLPTFPDSDDSLSLEQTIALYHSIIAKRQELLTNTQQLLEERQALLHAVSDVALQQTLRNASQALTMSTESFVKELYLAHQASQATLKEMEYQLEKTAANARIEEYMRSANPDFLYQLQDDISEQLQEQQSVLDALRQQLVVNTAESDKHRDAFITISNSIEEKQETLSSMKEESEASLDSIVAISEQEKHHLSLLNEFHAKNAAHFGDYEKLLDILITAQHWIQKSANKSHMPFTDIDVLLASKARELTTFDDKRLEYWLITLDHELPKAWLTEQRERQANPLKWKASIDECSQVYRCLNDSIDRSIEHLKKVISTYHSLEEKQQVLLSRQQTLQAEKKKIDFKISEMVNVLGALGDSLEEQRKSLHEHSLQKRTLCHSQQKTEAQIQSLLNAKQNLIEVANLFHDVGVLREEMLRFEHNPNLFELALQRKNLTFRQEQLLAKWKACCATSVHSGGLDKYQINEVALQQMVNTLNAQIKHISQKKWAEQVRIIDGCRREVTPRFEQIKQLVHQQTTKSLGYFLSDAKTVKQSLQVLHLQEEALVELSIALGEDKPVPLREGQTALSMSSQLSLLCEEAEMSASEPETRTQVNRLSELRANEKRPLFLQLIANIERHINTMQTYGETLIEKKDPCGTVLTDIAQTLTNVVRVFNNTHRTNLPTCHEYLIFQAMFNQTLHHKDILIEAHSATWGTWLKNLLGAVCTLGYLLWFSRKTTGRYGFFVDERKGKSAFEALELATQQLVSESTSWSSPERDSVQPSASSTSNRRVGA